MLKLFHKYASSQIGLRVLRRVVDGEERKLWIGRLSGGNLLIFTHSFLGIQEQYLLVWGAIP